MKIGDNTICDLEKLIRKLYKESDEGTLESTRFLEQLVRNGLLEEYDGMMHKLRCLRCLQGDYEETWRMFEERRPIFIGFSEDLDINEIRIIVNPVPGPDGEIFHTEIPESRFLDRLKNRLDLDEMNRTNIIKFKKREPLDVLLGLNREKTVERLQMMADEGDKEAKAILWNITLPHDYSVETPKLRLSNLWDEWNEGEYPSKDTILGEMMDLMSANPEIGYSVAIDLYCGNGVERDPSKALEVALRSAEYGCRESKNLIITMTDSEIYTDGLNLSTTHHILNRRRDHIVAFRMMIQDSAEWNLICRLTETDPHGFTELMEHRNDACGYEDDVFSIRVFDDWSGDDEGVSWPNFTFKPTGLEMHWYKYAWRGATISEDLTVGEIKHIWRLCIDHLITGRTFNQCTTEEILRMEPYHVDIPDELRDRIAAATFDAPAALVEDRGWTVKSTYKGAHSTPWYFWTMRDVWNLLKAEGRVDDLSVLTDDILITLLEGYADNGVVEASIFLSEAYTEGGFVEKDEDKRYKFRCLRCLQGDFEECWRMLLEGLPVSKGFLEDDQDYRNCMPKIKVVRLKPYMYRVYYDLWDHESLDGWRDKNDINEAMHPYINHLYYEKVHPVILMDEIDHDETVRRLMSLSESGNEIVIDAMEYVCEPEDWPGESMDHICYILLSKLGYDNAFNLIYNEDDRDWDFLLPTRDVEDTTEAVEELMGIGERCPQACYFLALCMFCGRNMEQDPEKAFDLALRMAETGHERSKDLLVMITNHHIRTDDLRGSAPGMEFRDDRYKQDENDYACQDRRPYCIPDEMLLKNSLEWELLMEMMNLDTVGWCSGEHMNSMSGFEDDTIFTRPDADSYYDDERTRCIPHFLFKPSGYNMEWYDYPWRNGQMAENLTVGEIKHIWRLCLDHLITGRTFERCTTTEALELEPYHFPVPKGMEERVEKAIEGARALLYKVDTILPDFNITYWPMYEPEMTDETKEIVCELESRRRTE